MKHYNYSVSETPDIFVTRCTTSGNTESGPIHVMGWKVMLHDYPDFEFFAHRPPKCPSKKWNLTEMSTGRTVLSYKKYKHSVIRQTIDLLRVHSLIEAIARCGGPSEEISEEYRMLRESPEYYQQVRRELGL